MDNRLVVVRGEARTQRATATPDTENPPALTAPAIHLSEQAGGPREQATDEGDGHDEQHHVERLGVPVATGRVEAHAQRPPAAVAVG